MVALRIDAWQSWLSKLAGRNFVSGESLDALATYVLEVLADVFIRFLHKPVRVGDALGRNAYGAFALGRRWLLLRRDLDDLLRQRLRLDYNFSLSTRRGLSRKVSKRVSS
jgi:hypothetical protein